MPTSTRLWRIADGVAHEAFEHAAVVLNLESGMYYKLDSVAAAVWGALHDPIGLEPLTAMLLPRWDVDRGVLTSDLQRLLADLERLGLVTAVTE